VILTTWLCTCFWQGVLGALLGGESHALRGRWRLAALTRVLCWPGHEPRALAQWGCWPPSQLAWGRPFPMGQEKRMCLQVGFLSSFEQKEKWFMRRM